MILERTAGGRWAEFVVTLPLAFAAGSSTVDGRDTGEGGPSATPGGATARRRILVVDDEADILEATHMLLDMEGHEVRTASDGAQALKIAQAFNPDVVFSDIGMPEMVGYELARKLRQLPGKESTMIVAVTGYGTEADRQRSREAGFDQHLVKPVPPTALFHIVAAAAFFNCRPRAGIP